jgi:uncharacterized linocin/CFP29 family protein
MDSLKRSLAPITDAAWAEITREAKDAFRLNLSARSIVDVSEPHGLDFSAVNLGRLELPKRQKKDVAVRYGVRKVLPLVEARASFELGIWELDNMDRGARDPDLGPLHGAAMELAKFEEEAVYQGFAEAGITGLMDSSSFEPIAVKPTASALPEAVERAVLRLRYAEVDGPYALALGAALHTILQTGVVSGYPIRKRVRELIDGPIVLAPFLTGGVVVSRRGGDTELTLGQDTSIGYETHDTSTVRLFFSESFTFRVLAPEAVVPLHAVAKG